MSIYMSIASLVIFGLISGLAGWLVRNAFAAHAKRKEKAEEEIKNQNLKSLIVAAHTSRYPGQLRTIRGLVRNMAKRGF